MRPLVIAICLVLALTHVAPAAGEDANHIIPGCRAVTDEQSFKDLAKARECLGIIEGMRVGAILQSHILKAPPPFCIPDTVTRSQMVHVVVDFIDKQSPVLSTGAPDKDANMLSYFAYFAIREAWPCSS
jgi:Rap1a immunity proteins